MMKKYRQQRNWSLYNQKLKKIARIEFFISEEAIEGWHYRGYRKPGGKIIYSKHVIELCLLMKEFYKLAYRQTEGFVESVLEKLEVKLAIPDYTTLSRRAGSLKVKIRDKKQLINSRKESITVAIDSTGLSLYWSSEWRRLKHKEKKPGYEKWRKLHVAINVETGEILEGKYTKSTVNDCVELPSLLEAIEEDITAVCGDMAYDSVDCRKAIKQSGARQLIPPKRTARISSKNRNIKKEDREKLQERDEAINYINYNSINGDKSLARKSWKEKSGYHARSLVETTMWQIKSHCRDRLTNKREDSRATQAKIKCKVINFINAA